MIKNEYLDKAGQIFEGSMRTRVGTRITECICHEGYNMSNLTSDRCNSLTESLRKGWDDRNFDFRDCAAEGIPKRIVNCFAKQKSFEDVSDSISAVVEWGQSGSYGNVHMVVLKIIVQLEHDGGGLPVERVLAIIFCIEGRLLGLVDDASRPYCEGLCDRLRNGLSKVGRVGQLDLKMIQNARSLFGWRMNEKMRDALGKLNAENAEAIDRLRKVLNGE
jgi:hypothetical protein